MADHSRRRLFEHLEQLWRLPLVVALTCVAAAALAAVMGRPSVAAGLAGWAWLTASAAGVLGLLGNMVAAWRAPR